MTTKNRQTQGLNELSKSLLRTVVKFKIKPAEGAVWVLTHCVWSPTTTYSPVLQSHFPLVQERDGGTDRERERQSWERLLKVLEQLCVSQTKREGGGGRSGERDLSQTGLSCLTCQ